MTKGVAPCAVKVACTVLNGGEEETYHKATRLVPTQLVCGTQSSSICRSSTPGPVRQATGTMAVWTLASSAPSSAPANRTPGCEAYLQWLQTKTRTAQP